MLPSLLLITENPSVRYFFKKNLESQFNLIEAAREHTALQELSSSQLEFVVIDSHLEFSDALDLARKLRNKDLLIPILLITGRLKKSFRDTALDAGVTDFLHDQLDLDELETRIAILRKARESRKKTTEFSQQIPQKPSVEKSLSKRKLTPSKKELPISFKKKKGL